MRMDPPMSEPVQIADVPAASEADEPPDEPPEREVAVPGVAGHAPEARIRIAGTGKLRCGGTGVDDAAGAQNALVHGEVLSATKSFMVKEPPEVGLPLM